MGGDEVLLVGFVGVGGEGDGVIEHGDHVREGVAEEAGDTDGDVDARPAQFFEADQFQALDTRLDISSHTGITPSRARTSAIVAGGAHGTGPHTDRPTERGYSP